MKINILVITVVFGTYGAVLYGADSNESQKKIKSIFRTAASKMQQKPVRRVWVNLDENHSREIPHHWCERNERKSVPLGERSRDEVAQESVNRRIRMYQALQQQQIRLKGLFAKDQAMYSSILAVTHNIAPENLIATYDQTCDVLEKIEDRCKDRQAYQFFSSEVLSFILGHINARACFDYKNPNNKRALLTLQQCLVEEWYYLQDERPSITAAEESQEERDKAARHIVEISHRLQRATVKDIGCMAKEVVKNPVLKEPCTTKKRRISDLSWFARHSG